MPVTVGPQFHEGSPAHGLTARAVVLVDGVGAHGTQAHTSDVVPDVADVAFNLKSS